MYSSFKEEHWLSIYSSGTGTSVNTTNQINDILQYLMSNKCIMYYSCVNTIVISFLCNTHLYWENVIIQSETLNNGDMGKYCLSHILFTFMHFLCGSRYCALFGT